MIKSICIGSIFVIFISFMMFVYNARDSYNLPDDLVCENVVVLTGDKNRIPFAFDLVKKVKASNLLISGVYKSTKLRDILGEQNIGELCVILGYKALNTEGNAVEIKEVTMDMGMKEIVLITSDYHMYRSLYETKKHNKDLIVYPVKVKSSFNFKFLTLCFREFYYSLCILIRDIFKGMMNAEIHSF